MRDCKVWWIASVILIVGCAMAVAAEPADEAWKAYQSYRKAFAEATSMDELVPFLAAERAAQVAETPADEKGMMFEMIKEMSMAMGDLEVVGSSVDGESVVFDVKGIQHEGDQDIPITGTVTMVREDGAFKVSRESFKMGDSSSEE